MSMLQAKVGEIENNLNEWEPKLLKDLTDNRAKINQFDTECQDAFQGMRISL